MQSVCEGLHGALALELLSLWHRNSVTVAVLHAHQGVVGVAVPDLRNGHWVETLRLGAARKAAGAALGGGLLHRQALRERHHPQRYLRLPRAASSHVDPALSDEWIQGHRIVDCSPSA